MLLPRTALLLFLVPLSCDPPPITDYIEIVVASGATLEVDTFCEAECSPSLADVEVTLNDSFNTPTDGWWDILQYRLDYAVTGVDIPFFAAETKLQVPVGQAASFIAQLAGTAQTDVIQTATGGIATDGTATLTLAGYDQDGAIIQASVDFPIRFANLEDQALTGDTGSDTGLEVQP